MPFDKLGASSVCIRICIVLAIIGLSLGGCADGGGTDGTGLVVRVSGTLIDENQLPLSSVIVRSQTEETLSDGSGNFEIQSPRGENLIFIANDTQIPLSLASLSPEAKVVSVLIELDQLNQTANIVEVVVDEIDASTPSPTTVPSASKPPETSTPSTEPTTIPSNELPQHPGIPDTATPTYVPTVEMTPITSQPTTTPSISPTEDTTTPDDTLTPFPTSTQLPKSMDCIDALGCPTFDALPALGSINRYDEVK